MKKIKKNKQLCIKNANLFEEKIKQNMIQKYKEKRKIVILIQNNFSSEHSGMMQLLECLADEKYNWQIFDRDDWYMTPQEINDNYNMITNDVWFHAGMLRVRFKINKTSKKFRTNPKLIEKENNLIRHLYEAFSL